MEILIIKCRKSYFCGYSSIYWSPSTFKMFHNLYHLCIRVWDVLDIQVLFHSWRDIFSLLFSEILCTISWLLAHIYTPFPIKFDHINSRINSLAYLRTIMTTICHIKVIFLINLFFNSFKFPLHSFWFHFGIILVLNRMTNK